MAELEWSVAQRQCLARRIPTPETLQHELDAWADDRNAARITASWHFTQEDARQKLHWLYPCPQQDNITVSQHSGNVQKHLVFPRDRSRVRTEILPS